MPCVMRRAALAALVVALAAPEVAQARRVTLQPPARFDVALAQIRYAVPHGPRPALRLVPGPTGTNYVAAALPRRQPRHALVALVAVVNRAPRGTLLPGVDRIVLSALPSRALAAPTVSEAMNVLAAAPATPPPACALGPLAVADLLLAAHAGAPPPGFSARATVAQALAAACGRPVVPAFRAAVGESQPRVRKCPPPCLPAERADTIMCPLAIPPGICPRLA
jgi:hypothetical protein